MRTRQIITTVALASGLLAAPALPASAAPTGGCPTPANRPVLAMTLPSVVSGNAVAAVAGTFRQNGCGIASAKIHLQSRPLVNGQPAGTWKTVTVVTTGAKGGWKASLAPGHNVRVRAFFSQAGGFPTTYSSVKTLLDAIRITKHVTTPGACKIHLSGSTTPVQSNRKVTVQSRGPVGHFQGWFAIGSTKTHADGTYSTTATANCATTYNLRVYIAGTATNVAGHSGTTFGIKPVH